MNLKLSHGICDSPLIFAVSCPLFVFFIASIVINVPVYDSGEKGINFRHVASPILVFLNPEDISNFKLERFSFYLTKQAAFLLSGVGATFGYFCRK